ncbi:MAG: hypothetical protein J6Q69_06225 [Clostridia bacterium]|nr:hypothetical protein [Clostridia bacterium]
MKRIICSILVVVMLVLSLVSCGYSFRKDDMSNYASFTDKESFAQALMSIVIENGEFELDATVREEKVLDTIYSAISSATKADGDKLKEGKPNVYDLVYYAYYATAEFKIDDTEETETAYFYTDKLKTTSPASILLRNNNNYGKDKFSAGVAAILSEYLFNKRDIHTATTRGTLVEGDIVYVTYTKKEKGATTSDTFTRQRVEVIKAAEGEDVTFASALLGKKITTTAFNLTEKKDGKDVDIEFKEGEKTYIYSNVKTEFVVSRAVNGITVEGDKAYITYNVKNLEGDGKTTKKTNELVIVGAAPAEGATATDLASAISGAEISKIVKDKDDKELSLTIKKTINVDAEGNYTEAEDKIAGTKEIDVVYSQITVNWIMSEDTECGRFTDVIYEEAEDKDDEVKVTDSTGKERVLNGKEITYHIYPVYYIDTPEYTAELLVDKVIGKNISFETICQILFVNDYAELDDDAEQADIDKINEKAANFKSGDLSIKDIAESIAKYYTDIEDAEKGVESAQTALDTATEAYDTAKGEYDNAVAEGKTGDELESLRKAYEAADAALNGKKLDDGTRKEGDGAQAKYDAAVKKKKDIEDKKTSDIAALLAIKETEESETVGTILLKNYKILNYNALQDSYNEELRMNLASEIYDLIDKYVTLNGKLPKDAVNEAYEQYIDAYKSDFYNGTFDSTKKITNYEKYNGKFNDFLLVKVAEDEKDRGVEIDSVKAAKDVLKTKAEEEVSKIVKFYFVAEEYELVVTKKEYNKFKDELEDYYYYYVLYYKNFDLEEMIGKTNIEAACQFDKLMNHFLAFDEVKGETDANGYTEITYKYTSTLVPEIPQFESEAED